MESAAGISSFQERLTSRLVQTTRTVGQLSSEDLNFVRSSSSEISESLDEQSDRILSLTSSLLKAATAGTDIPAPKLRDEESIEDNWRSVVDVIDALLEKADACLDEFTGVIKRLSPSKQERATKPLGRKAASNKFPSVYDYGPSKIPKPQLQFDHLPDNTDVSPFRPLLRTKPHALVPLEESIRPVAGTLGYRNPYETEIRSAKFPESTYVASSPIDYRPFESTTAIFVDTVEGVNEMLEELKSAKEIAIDLEHHDVHSYHGLVSLMQISTREKDWVVDTLKPWREELQVLNEVFADPSILKVLHGSSMDIIWLQRDLGLYVVNMFDTYHAACALNYPKRSLKYLLMKFVNFEADKRYQMADWRIRPLPQGMFDYARSDTHYLLYVYDHLRNELIQNSTPEHNLIDYVLEQSQNEALQRYERPVYDAASGQGPGGWYDALSRSSTMLSKEQFAVFKAVHQWRDEVARAEDEGVQCVFPKHILFRVALAMPMDQGTLFRTVSAVTPIIQERASELLEVIRNAKLSGADGPEWRDVMRPAKSAAALNTAVGGEPATALHAAAAEVPRAGRFEVSQFWGSSLDVPGHQMTPLQYSITAAAEALRLSLPLPPMPMTVTEVHEKLAIQPTTAPTKRAAPTEAAEAAETDDKSKVFTVKELGGPKKRKITGTASVDNTTTSQLDDLATDAAASTDTSVNMTRKQRKKARKDRLAAESLQPGSSDSQASVPFDYANAESVLHAAPVAAPAERSSKRPFNPYLKSLDGPRGAPKMRKDTPGKTMTFR